MGESRDDAKSGSSPSPASGAPRLRGWKTKPLLALPVRDSTSRLTLDFSGPLLSLPAPVDEDVVPPPPPTTPRTGHDAWAVDRVRRSTPPPMQVSPGWLERALSKERLAPPAAPTEASPTGTDGSALDLVEQARPSSLHADHAQEMADRFALGDFSGALVVAELILGQRPSDPAAARYAQASREKLEQLYGSRLGSLQARPRVVVAEANIRWLGLDHRAGFILSRVDGHSTIEEIVDTSGMPRLEALRTLCDLIDLRAIALDQPPAAATRRR